MITFNNNAPINKVSINNVTLVSVRIQYTVYQQANCTGIKFCIAFYFARLRYSLYGEVEYVNERVYVCI